MPAGLVNSLNPDELSDLIAYIFSAGDPDHKYFVKPAYEAKIDGATSLFNGKDLTGWKGNPKLWSVKDGVIVGSSHGNKLKGNTFLILEGDDLTDFHLTYQARVEGNNSGVQYRSAIVDENNFVMRGYQADMHPKQQYLAMLYEEKGRGILVQRGQKVDISEGGKKSVLSQFDIEPTDASKWQTYEVIAKGDTVIHKLNGTVAMILTDASSKRLKSGRIGLQLHAGAPMKVEYRNIKLKRF